MSFSVIFIRGSATCMCVGNQCSDMFSSARNLSRSMNTTILKLLSWLCPTSFLLVLAKLSRRPSESCEPCALPSTNTETSELTAYPSDGSEDLSTLLMLEFCQLVIVLRSKTSSLHQLRMVRETTNQTTLRLLTFSVREASVSNNGTGTRNDDAHFSRAFPLLNKFVQRFNIGERLSAQFLSRQRDTTAQVWPRLLSQPQQLSQHTSLSSDLSVREWAFQSS